MCYFGFDMFWFSMMLNPSSITTGKARLTRNFICLSVKAIGLVRHCPPAMSHRTGRWLTEQPRISKPGLEPKSHTMEIGNIICFNACSWTWTQSAKMCKVLFEWMVGFSWWWCRLVPFSIGSWSRTQVSQPQICTRDIKLSCQLDRMCTPSLPKAGYGTTQQIWPKAATT